jgi:hypothetical protein
MAVTKAQFLELDPLAYAAARGDMQTGDILLFNSKDLGARIIETFTKSLWCHAAFVLVLKDIDRVFLLESVNKIGVRMMPVSIKLNGIPGKQHPTKDKVLLARYQGFPHEDGKRVGEMTKVALDRLGYPYSLQELAMIAERIAQDIIGEVSKKKYTSQKNAYICSEYVAMCYQAMGIQIVRNKAGFMSPADIANDPNVFPVHALKPD